MYGKVSVICKWQHQSFENPLILLLCYGSAFAQVVTVFCKTSVTA
jgi:hypothetical protein